jgi:xylan 1,4-beta-xylosidase
LAKQLQAADQGFAAIRAVPSLADKPVVIGESDPEGCAACTGPQNAYRNGTLYSAYTAESFARIAALADARGIRLAGALSWSFTFVGQPWFAGYRQLASNGVALPVLNLFKLYARMGDTRLGITNKGALPLDRVLHEGVRDAPDIGALASRRDDGVVTVLLWNYHDDDLPGPAARIHLTLARAGRSRRAILWRVDSAHGDAFTAWRAMGSPASPDEGQRAALLRAAALKPESVAVAAGGLTLSLPRQGVALIEFRR